MEKMMPIRRGKSLFPSNRPEALMLLLIDALVKKRGREWLPGLVEKINEKVKNDSAKNPY